MNIDTVGMVSPVQYNIVISGGMFDRQVWSAVIGGVWKIRGLESERAVIYNGEMYRVVEETALTYTDGSAEGYYEAMIPSADTTKNLDMYYKSSSLAIESVFDINEGYTRAKNYKQIVKLYVSDDTDITLPLNKTLTIEYAVEGITYTGTVSAPSGSNSTVVSDNGDSDKTTIYRCEINEEDATVYIQRDGQYVYGTDLADAFSKAQDGDTIVVFEDHTTAKAILTGKNNVTLDLNGKVVYGPTSNSITLDITDAQNFTIKDSQGNGALLTQHTSTSTSYATIFLRGNTTVTITGGAFGRLNMTENTRYWLNFYSSFSGTLTIMDGTFVGKISGAGASKLFIQGGTFTADPAGYIGGNNGYNAVLYKDGAYYIVIKTELQHDNESNANYYEAVIPTKLPNTYADYYYASANDAISALPSLGTTGYDTLRLVVYLYASASQDIQLKAYTTLTIYKESTIHYTGNVTAVSGYELAGPTDVDGGVKYEVKLSENSDKIKVEVSHGDEIRYYDSLSNAFKYAQDGDTITLKANVTTATLTINNITLDLNGYKITGSTTVITVDGAKNLTIKDSVGTGAIETSSKTLGSNSAGAIILQNGATVTIESGVIGNTNGAGYNCFVFVGGESFTGKLTIKGGTFTGTFWNATANSNIVIEGGDFTTDPSSYVAEDFTVSEPNEDGYYTVTAKN